jgi:Protein of unknown function (DUF3224)
MRRLVLVLLLLGATLLTASPAQADSSVPASGTFTVANETVKSVQPVGQRCLITLIAVFDFQGTLVGTWNPPASFILIQQAPCGQTGPTSFVAVGIFKGTVNGVPGTFDFWFSGSLPDSTRAEGTLVILGATSGLTGLSGTLVLVGTPHVGGTYSGSLELDS